MDNTQWNDTDGDGYGDNPSGTQGDACPTEAGTSLRSLANNLDHFGCPDDGDGFVDEPFPEDPTQWLDEDQDGLGDNATGTNLTFVPTRLQVVIETVWTVTAVPRFSGTRTATG